MTVAAPSILVYFGSDNVAGDFFVLDDDVKGELDNTTYVLGGDTGTLVDGEAFQLSVSRGRNRELDEYDAGTASVTLHNRSRLYDDTYAAGDLFGLVTPGKRATISIWGNVVFDGFVEDWDANWTVNGFDTVSFVAEDGLGQLAKREYDEWTTTSQKVGARLAAALNRDEVNYSIARDFDDGRFDLQSDLVTWGSNVLNYLQLVTKSDAGRLFVTRQGVLRFQDRTALVNPTSTADFRDDGTGIPFHGITTSNGADLLFNRVGIDREGGTLQTSEDTDSQTAVGIRALNISGLLLDSDGDAALTADWFLNLYKTPMTRVSSITIKVNALTPLDRGYVTQLDIGDVVSVSWTPQGVGDALEQLLVIEGVSHDCDAAGFHVMTLYTSLATQVGMFVLDDTTYGLLDTGGRLAF